MKQTLMIIAFIFLSPNVRSANLISKFFDETENVIVKAFEKARVRWEPTILELSYDAGKLKLAPKMEYEVDDDCVKVDILEDNIFASNVDEEMVKKEVNVEEMSEKELLKDIFHYIKNILEQNYTKI